MKNDLANIFVGSDIEANYIASILTDNEIRYIVQNTFGESISAGWASGSSYNGSIIRVNIEDAEKAKELIKEFFKARNSS